MTWFKVDDALAFHQKALIAGNPAMGLWVRAGSWCGQQLSDGFVPSQIAGMLGTTEQIEALVFAGLWIGTDGGFLFHEWEQHQPTRAEVEERRVKDRERKAEWRASKASQRDTKRTPAGTPSGIQKESALPVPSRPVPTRPDNSNTDQSSHLSNHASNADLTDQHVSAIQTELAHHADIEAETSEARAFGAYVLSNAKTAVGNPAAYVKSSIAYNPAETSQWFKQHRRTGRAAS